MRHTLTYLRPDDQSQDPTLQSNQLLLCIHSALDCRSYNLTHHLNNPCSTAVTRTMGPADYVYGVFGSIYESEARR